MNLHVALLPGDGIGPEVISQAVKVCNSIAKKFNHKIVWEEGLIGAVAIDKVGDPFPPKTLEICKRQMLFYLELLEIRSMIMTQQLKFVQNKDCLK